MELKQFEDIQLIYTILKVLRFWGLLYVRNWVSYTCLFIAAIIIIAQLQFLLITVNEPDDIIGNLYTVVLWATTASRGYAMVFDNKAYEALVTELSENYAELKKFKDPYVDNLLQEMNSKGRTMTRGNFVLGSLSCVAFFLYPFLTNKKVLPFGVTMPFIDLFETPLYQITYIIEMITLPMGCCMYIAPTCLSVSFCIFGIVMCQTLQNLLRKLGTNNESPEQIRRDIIICIKFHKRIIRFISNVNNLVKYIFLEDFIAFGTLLCALLFMLIIVETMGQRIMVFANITMVLAQIFAVYWYTNECMEQNLAIAKAAYDTNWYTFQLSEQKLIYVLIMKAQKMEAITIGNIRPMTLQLFQSLLNATYSYFTLLQRIYA